MSTLTEDKIIQNQKFTKEDVAKHNKKNDCWIIVKNKVYDITKFIEDESHPGGEYILLSKGGEDATDAMHDIGHSEDAYKMMATYYIGELD